MEGKDNKAELAALVEDVAKRVAQAPRGELLKIHGDVAKALAGSPTFAQYITAALLAGPEMIGASLISAAIVGIELEQARAAAAAEQGGERAAA